jgi:DNA-binding transcriptional ArsR family regulator
MMEALLLPDDRLVIDDLETLRISADPLRMRIVGILRRSPATVKEIAAVLEVSPKLLYYHVNLLERHGLVRVVDTRLVSGILEKRYRAAAYLFVFSDLINQDAGQQGLQVVVSHFFAITSQEIGESIARGQIDLQGQDTPAERALRWDWRLLQLSPEEAEALSARLHELLDGYANVDGRPVAPGTQTYRFLQTLFPTYTRGAPPAAESPE